MKSEWRKQIRIQEKEIKRLQLELEFWKRKASIDYMTGALNKCEGMRKLQEKMEECFVSQKNLTIAFIDIDQLKVINDGLGHCVGDKLLKEVAQLLKKNIRKEDYIFRFGGDEFVIVFSHTTEKEVKEIWDRIRMAILRYNENGGPIFPMSLSSGFYEYKKGMNLTPEELIEMADRKMYEEKKQKRQNLQKYIGT